jgi:AraC-type DNA-binding domain-containing proteins
MEENCSDLLKEDNLFGIEYIKANSQGSMKVQHYHEHYEIYYQFYGERYYFIKDRSYFIKKGDIVLVNKFELHKTSFAGNEHYERILINFKESYIDEYLNYEGKLFNVFNKNINVFRLTLVEQDFIENILNRMLKENEELDQHSKIYMKISLIELLIFLDRYILNTNKQYVEHPSALHKKNSEIAQYINNYYYEKLTLKHISEKYNVSTYYFSRNFKAVTGFSFIEYLNITRIKAAQKLLVETELSIIEVAEKVGFDNQTHFGRVFKNITQITPLNYRKLKK